MAGFWDTLEHAFNTGRLPDDGADEPVTVGAAAPEKTKEAAEPNPYAREALEREVEGAEPSTYQAPVEAEFPQYTTRGRYIGLGRVRATPGVDKPELLNKEELVRSIESSGDDATEPRPVSGGGRGAGHYAAAALGFGKPDDTYGGKYYPLDPDAERERELAEYGQRWSSGALPESGDVSAKDAAYAKINAKWDQYAKGKAENLRTPFGIAQDIQSDQIGTEGARVRDEAERALRAGAYEGQIAQKYNQAAGQVEQSAERIRGLQEAFHENWNKQYADIQRAQEELSKATIDPNRTWGLKQTPFRLLSIVSAALMGYANTLTGRQGNSALEMMENAIERDIAAQKATLANRGRALGQRKNQLGMLRAKLGNDVEAEYAYRDAMLKRFGSQLTAMAHKTGNKEMMARADSLNRQIEESRVRGHKLLKLNAANKWAQEQMMILKGRGGSGSKVIDGYRPLDKKEVGNIIWDPAKKGQALGILTGVNHDDVKAVREAAETYYKQDTFAARMQELVGKGLSTGWHSEDAYEIKQLFSRIRLPLKKEFSGAAETDQEKAAIDAMINGTATRAQAEVAVRLIQKFRGHSRTEFMAKARVNGLRNVDVQGVVDPKTGNMTYYGREGGRPQDSAPPKERLAGWD